MAYQLAYTGEQVDESVKYAVDPTIFGLKSNVDTPMNQVILATDTYQDVEFSNVTLSLNGDFTYDGDIVTYVGVKPILCSLNLSTSVVSSANNTIIHIGQAKNGVVDTGSESSAKCESSTAEQSLNIATYFNLETNDTLNLKIKADKLATIGMNHFQVVLAQKKIQP